MDLKKLWPTIVAMLTIPLAQFAPQIQDFVAGHPTLAMIVGSIAVLIANLVKSPNQPSA